MNKILIASLLMISLTGCASKTKFVPQAYMPEPPEALMRAPKDLNTIKKQDDKKEETPDEEV